MLKTDMNHDQYYCQNPSYDLKNKKQKIKSNQNKKAQTSQKLILPYQDKFEIDIFKNIKKTVSNIKKSKSSIVLNDNYPKNQLKNSIQLILTQNILQNFKLQKQTYQKRIVTNSSSKGKLNLKNLLKHQSCNLKTLKQNNFPENNYDQLGQYFCDSVRFQKLSKNSKSHSKSNSRSKKSRGSITSPLRSIRRLNKFDQIRSPISKVCEVIKKEQKQLSRKNFLTKKNSLQEQISQSRSLDKLNQIFRKRQLFTPKIKTMKNISAIQIEENYYNGSLKRQINNNQTQEINQKRFIKNQKQQNKYFLQKYFFRNEPQSNKKILMKQKINDIEPINYVVKDKQVQQKNQYQQFELVHNLLSNPKLSQIPSNVTENKIKTLQFSHKHPQLKKSVSCEFDYSDYGIQNQQSQLISQQQLKNTLQELQQKNSPNNKNEKNSQYKQNKNIESHTSQLKRSKISIDRILSPQKNLSISGSNKSLRVSSKKKNNENNLQNNLFHSQKFKLQAIKSNHKSSQSSLKNGESSDLIDDFQDYSQQMSQKKITNRLSQKFINDKKLQENYFQAQYAVSLKNLQSIQSKEKVISTHQKQVKNTFKQSKDFPKKEILQDQTQLKKQKSPIVRIISLKNIHKDNINKINKNKGSSKNLKKYSDVQNYNQSSLQQRLSKVYLEYSSNQKSSNNNKSKITSAVKSSQRISQDSSSFNKQIQYTSQISLTRSQDKKQKTKSNIKSSQNINLNKNMNGMNISISQKIVSESNTNINSSSRRSLQSNPVISSKTTLPKHHPLTNPPSLNPHPTLYSFKKKKPPTISLTLPQTIRLIEQHQQRIQSLCLYIDNCKNFYQQDYDIQKYQLLCFLMLKKNIYQIERVINGLLLKQKNVFNLTEIQIEDQNLEQYRSTEEINHILKNIQKDKQQRKKQFLSTYYSIEKKYQNQKGFNLSIENDDFSNEIVNKLIQQLNILYEKWEKNKSDGDKLTAIKISKKFEKRMKQIIQLIFLISQLDGRKIKAFQLFTEKQEDFRTYYETHFQKIIQTIEYFDLKKRNNY